MKNREINLKTEPSDELLRRAFWSAFPGGQSFADFITHDPETAQSAADTFIALAFDRGLITRKTHEDFTDFLNRNTAGLSASPWPAGMTFSDMINLLREGRSVNTLVDRLNNLARQLSMPAVSAPMITRLKKNYVLNSSKKRALIRLAAFMLAMKRPDLNWHYEKLVDLAGAPLDSPLKTDATAGCTLTLHLHAPGGAVTPEDVAWLNQELIECLNDLRLAGHLGKKTIEPIGATSFNLKSPKRIGPAQDPVLYDRPVRNLLGVAHQMSVRWLICPRSNVRKKLILLIHAGSFSGFFPQRLLVRLPLRKLCDSGICLSDFACLCAKTAGIKADFSVAEAALYSGAHRGDPLWFVDAFWPNQAHDFIPALLKPGMLPLDQTDPSYRDFQFALHYPEERSRTSFGVISLIHRHPRSKTLLLEIARILLARKMPSDADAVTSLLLLSYPESAAVRYLRLLILCNQANGHSGVEEPRLAFERGLSEGTFILEQLGSDSDLWFTMAMLHFGQAIALLRKTPAPQIPSGAEKTVLLSHLQNTRTALRRGMAASAAGQTLQCLLWLLPVETLLALISKPVDGGGSPPPLQNYEWSGLFYAVGFQMLGAQGWVQPAKRRGAPLTENDLEQIIRWAEASFLRHENTVMGRTYLPCIRYFSAAILWDFSPKPSGQVVEKTLSLLHSAKMGAETLRQDHLCVYSAMGHYLPPDVFIDRINKAIDAVATCAGGSVWRAGRRDRRTVPAVSGRNFLLAEIFGRP